MLSTPNSTTSTTEGTTTVTETTTPSKATTEKSTEETDIEESFEYIYVIQPANKSTYIHIEDLKPNKPYKFKFEIQIFDHKGNAFRITAFANVVNLH